MSLKAQIAPLSEHLSKALALMATLTHSYQNQPAVSPTLNTDQLQQQLLAMVARAQQLIELIDVNPHRSPAVHVKKKSKTSKAHHPCTGTDTGMDTDRQAQGTERTQGTDTGTLTGTTGTGPIVQPRSTDDCVSYTETVRLPMDSVLLGAVFRQRKGTAGTDPSGLTVLRGDLGKLTFLAELVCERDVQCANEHPAVARRMRQDKAVSLRLFVGGHDRFELIFPSLRRDGALRPVSEDMCQSVLDRSGVTPTKARQHGDAWSEEWETGELGLQETQRWVCALVQMLCTHALNQGDVDLEFCESLFAAAEWM